MTDVVLSPSSQTWNQYAGGGAGITDSEARWMRALADIVTPMLRASGLTVVDLRDSSLEARVRKSNAIRPRVHVALHSNAFNGAVRGAIAYVYRQGSTAYDMAGSMIEPLAELIRPKGDTVRVVNHYETRMTTSPAVILEVDFHDALAGAEFIRRNLQAIASATVRGILAALGKPSVASPAPVPEPSPTVPNPAPVPAPPAITVYPVLLVDGVFGPVSVRALQTLLASVGYYKGLIDGVYGPITVYAVQAWLAKRGYYGGIVDGIEGPVTVRALQRFLTAKGLYGGLIDGVRGAVTNKAWQTYLNDQRQYL